MGNDFFGVHAFHQPGVPALPYTQEGDRTPIPTAAKIWSSPAGGAFPIGLDGWAKAAMTHTRSRIPDSS